MVFNSVVRVESCPVIVKWVHTSRCPYSRVAFSLLKSTELLEGFLGNWEPESFYKNMSQKSWKHKKHKISNFPVVFIKKEETLSPNKNKLKKFTLLSTE